MQIPRVYWNLTTRRVLTMDFEEGGQVNDLQFIDQNGIRREEVTSRLGEMYAHMIFKHGFVHSDPHPGNILLQVRDGRLNVVLLDHGLYAVSFHHRKGSPKAKYLLNEVHLEYLPT